MAKVYISCHHPDPANELAAALVAAGHEVVSAWHTSADPRPAADDADAWSEKTVANFAAIRAADALVLIASPDHISRERCVTGGKFVEAGYAFACDKGVYTVGGVENGMLYHWDISHAKDSAELLAMINRS